MSALRKLADDDRYPIPAKALQQNIITLGKTGAGKSSALRAVIEPMLEDGMPVCIIDPKGDWWGLKLAADGKRPGYPLVIFGGKHADVPLNERAGAHVAELFATGNRPCIIDLRGWMPGERSRFFVDFASTLYKHNVGRKWLVIDECHNFTPKGKVLDVDSGKCLHWANKLASEGRGLGITLIGASQRPQKVHNDFLTSCETLIAMRVLHASDRVAYKEWIDGCGDPERGKEMLATIANLKRGTGYVWSPEIEFGPELVKFPMFSTYDSFKPQEASDVAKLSGWAEVDLEDTKAKLATVIEEHKANDPAELKKQIRELQRQVAAKAPPPVDEALIKRRQDEAFQDGHAVGKRNALEHAATVMQTIGHDIAGLFQRAIAQSNIEASKVTGARPENPIRRVEPVARAARLPESAPKVARARQIDGRAPAGETLPKGEAATLAACIQFPDGLRREQLTVLTGYKRSSRDAYIQRLRERGYVDTVGDRVTATDAGIAALPDAEPLPTGQALQEYWLAKLPEGERKILEVLLEHGGSAIPRGDLDAATGYQRSSRDAYLQRLRAKQLISEPSRGEVCASENLF